MNKAEQVVHKLTESYQKKLLKEQEMGRREIRKLISKAAFAMGDLTQCLKPWGWTFHATASDGGYWRKIFNLSHSLFIEGYEDARFQNKLIVELSFSPYVIFVWTQIPRINDGEEIKEPYFRSYHCALPNKFPESNISFILHRYANEISEIIDTVKPELFYDETKQQQIEAIRVLELAKKIERTFRKICKTFGAG